MLCHRHRHYIYINLFLLRTATQKSKTPLINQQQHDASGLGREKRAAEQRNFFVYVLYAATPLTPGTLGGEEGNHTSSKRAQSKVGVMERGQRCAALRVIVIISRRAGEQYDLQERWLSVDVPKKKWQTVF
jgi:hypothetical protein